MVGGKLEGFVRDFGKDLDGNLFILQLIVRELSDGGKEKTLEKVRAALQESYPSGKVNGAIVAIFAYVENPQSLGAMESKSRYTFAAYYLSKYFANAESYEVAHKYIVKALDKEANLSIKLDYLHTYADICKKCSCDKPHDFEDRIINLLRDTKEESKKAELHKRIGEHYLKLGEKDKALLFLESYLLSNPNDTETRFTVAYEYAQLNKLGLAHHHYSIHNFQGPTFLPSQLKSKCIEIHND